MITNFFRISIPFDHFDIQRLDYSEQKLCSLRAEHNANASFFRDGDYIYISPKKGAELALGKHVRLDVSHNPDVVAKTIRHLVFRRFRDAFPERVPEEFAPLRFPSLKEEHDPLRKLLPNNLHQNLGFPRVNEVHVRSITEGASIVHGLLILSRHRWRFPLNLAELLAEKFPLAGCSVLQAVPLPGMKGVLGPEETVLGEVQAVQGTEATIHSNDGTIKRPLSELHLQRTREQIGKYLEFKIGPAAATKVFQQLRDLEQEDVASGRNYGEIVRVGTWFSKQQYENDDGFTFKVTDDRSVAPAGIRLEPTKLVFDYSPGASSDRPFSGLTNFGPFDSARFDCKRPRLLAVFHQRNHGAATQFLAQLIEGIPSSSYYKKGLRDLFRLHDVDHVLKELQASFAEDYENAIDQAVKEAGANRFHLALVECPDDSRAFPVAENPYYRAKARLMSYGIPVQCVRESHLRQGPSSLAWTLGPTALQIYAKLGGVPWLVPGSQSVDAELIVGIGNTIQRPNLWAGAEQSRVVGLTTFFLGDGRYIMGNELRSVPYSEYFKELLLSLEESINFVSKEYAWKDGKTVRLVFYVFKPLKNLEVDVVNELIQRFPRFKIIFAFITVSKFHPWMMFQSAVEEGQRWRLTLCDRGANLVLDEHSCLMQLRGDKDRPNKKHRPPYPVLVRIHEKSTYKDLHFITQQILDFSFLCWRSFFPTEMPVPIFYSSLMAELSAKLQRVKGWNPLFLDQHFRRKTWFL